MTIESEDGAISLVKTEPMHIAIKEEDFGADIKLEWEDTGSLVETHLHVKEEEVKHEIKEEEVKHETKEEEWDIHPDVKQEDEGYLGVKHEPGASLVANGSEDMSVENNAAAEDFVEQLFVADQDPLESEPHQAPHVALSDEQQSVVDRVKAGQGLFFTGPAGTGKSVVLREIVRWCHSARRVLYVTASTCMAALHIDGYSLHYWAGINLGIGSAQRLADKIMDTEDRLTENAWKGKIPKERYAEWQAVRHAKKRALQERIYCDVYQRWLHTDILIIDEISMINGNLFDKLEEIARILRGNDSPFGGIQLVLTGDFFQLPPVWKAGYQRPKFTFEARSWAQCAGKTMALSKVFRQTDDKFVAMLNSLRRAVVNDEIIDMLKGLKRKVIYDDGIDPIDVFPNNAEVAAENKRRLWQLQGENHEYTAFDIPGTNKEGIPFDEITVEKALKDSPAPAILNLKVGAKVMLLKTLVQGHLVNGLSGEVLEFISVSEAQERRIPVGSSDLREAQLFVKSSRKRLRISEEPDHALLYPVVRFNHPKKGPIYVLCVPNSFNVDTKDGKTRIATRYQIPLDLGWAMTIHKCQGQSIARLRVHIGGVFVSGQAYVALSRATSMETLEVCDFDVKKITAHPIVIKWMDTGSVPMAGNTYDKIPSLPIANRLHSIEPDGINSIVMYPEDLLRDPPPQPDDMPYSESYSEEDELWATFEHISLSDHDLAAIDALSSNQCSDPSGRDDEVYWSQVDDIPFGQDSTELSAAEEEDYWSQVGDIGIQFLLDGKLL